MKTFFVVISTWLHALATIVMIGYYIFTSLIYLHVFERQMQANALRELLEQVSARLRLYFGGSLLIFLVTGIHIILINESYLGFGSFFANLWSVLIVVKHVLVVTFLALAVYSKRAFLGQISDHRREALKNSIWRQISI